MALIDPPYDADPWDRVMKLLDEEGLLERDRVVVAEHSSRRELAPRYGRLARVKSRRYGDTSVSVYVVEGVA